MVLIKYATRGRVAQFLRNMKLIKDNTVTPYKVIVSCDEDDRTMNNKKIIEYVGSLRCPHSTIHFSKRTTKIGAINRDMEHAGQWDILVNYSDDVRLVMRAWDRRMMACITRKWGTNTDFFAHFSDGYVFDRLPTVSIMGYDYWSRDQYIYYPEYKSFSCDAEAMYVAMMRKRYYYFKDLFFKHDHPANSRLNKYDILYKHNSKYSEHDTQLYFARLKNFFDETEGRDVLLARPELKRYVSSPDTIHVRRGESLRQSLEPDQKTIDRGGDHLKPGQSTRTRWTDNGGSEEPAA